jgi:hypothetical protein
MNKKILVPLGQYDRSEEMIPYVENVARPGMKVVFLVRYPMDGFIWAKEEYGMRAGLKAKELVNYYSWEGNLEKAKKQVAPACEALRAKAIEAGKGAHELGIDPLEIARINAWMFTPAA